MNSVEQEILKMTVMRGGLLSPAELINGIAKGDRKSVENLVVQNYIEEVPQDKQGINGVYTLNFYRATEKGILVFKPWYTKTWFILKNDIHTITVATFTAAITAVIASIVTIFVERYFNQ